MYWCHVPQMIGAWAPVVHAPCVHNEYSGLLWRTLGPTPAYVPNRWLEREWRRLRTLARKTRGPARTMEQVVAKYRGAMRVKYQSALNSLVADGVLTRQDRRLSAFVKGEKVNPMARSPTKPRVIMARSPRYNLRLATRLQPLEARLWASIRGTCPGVEPLSQVAKGLNPRARASIVAAKMEAVGEGCVVFEVDGSRFEAHVTRRDLLDEHSVYKAAYPGDVELRDLLQTQLELKGHTASGIKYERDGCRASGDFNTGMGNTLIMLAATRATVALLASRLGSFKYDLLADGDNCLIFVEAWAARRLVSEFASACAEVSTQELVVEKPTTVLEEVVFGQSHPLYNGEHWTMVREFTKMISGAFCGYKHFHSWRFGIRVLKAVAQAELYLARGLPVIQAYMHGAVRELAGVPDLPDPTPWLEGHTLDAIKSAGTWEAVLAALPRAVTHESRASFERAFGVSADEQVRMEEAFPRQIVFPHRTGFAWDKIDVWDVDGPEVVPIMDTLYADAH